MTCKGHGSKPVMVVCPTCEPGPYAFAGTIISRTCDGCKKLLRG